jgi:[glutamine synthetase] adenylyltransferase / [glutamine synthetase]-adenylyl-L-tyrosine phosphorylase
VKFARPTDLPPSLEHRFRHVAARLAELPVHLPAEVVADAVRVAVISDFVLSTLVRQTESLTARLADPAPLDEAGLATRLRLDGLDLAQAMATLRRFRQLETARIAWRDLTGAAPLAQSLADLSTLADALIQSASSYAMAELAPRHGTPMDESGAPAPLLVLAMGKLGGRELNFSSDVDLVFLHPDEARIDGREQDDVEAYYRRLAQLLIRLLDQPTEDGFVLRVDTRLRPFGNSGPLVIGTSAFESYLVQHGRDWERYAYLKARLVTGPRYRAAVFDQILTPYVYRGYIDYGVFDALRHMKRLISQEVARKEMIDNVKLGPGGIREIEFIVQAFQLVRGGREARLRTPSLLDVLPQLGGERELGATAVEDLLEAYGFLRIVENRLQAMDDRQTHTLPDDPENRARLAWAVGAADWTLLVERLDEHRHAVEREFDRVAWDAHERSRSDAAETGGVAAEAWDDGDVGGALAGTPLAGHGEVERLLASLRSGGLYQRMDELSRQRLAAVVVRTIPLLAGEANPVETLARVLSVFQAICRRSAYLALLHENPRALERLLALASQSALLARQIAEHPLLLDELLDARIFETPPTRVELAEALRRNLGRADAHDIEARLEAMRQFQRTAVFRVAIADRLGHLPLMKVSDRLTDIAELVLELSLTMAWDELVSKYGAPLYGEPPDLREAGFAVIGYGKLGGLELGYGSDLDLVFLHDSAGSHQETNGAQPLDNSRFFSRLVQRLIHFLTIQTSSGRLYEVDTRLRPSGRAGLMVASVENFRRYQRGEAWVWEHQALLRSRSVAGSPSIRESFERDRKDILIHHVVRDRLKEEIVKMRSRMRAELSRGGGEGFDLKQDPGGLADLEFLVDYWVLRHAPEHPALVEFPDNVRQLEALEAAGLITAERAQDLKNAYLALRRRVHELALDERERVVGAGELADVRELVTSVWDEVFG